MNPMIAALRDERKRLGLSQQDVGRRIGRETYASVWAWEAEKCDPKLGNFVDWAAALGFQVSLTKDGDAP